MIVKVCGIRNLGNLSYLNESDADWIGFIFYDKSKRNFPDGDLGDADLEKVTKKKVGVFVNEEPERLVKTADVYALDMVQLHGDESVEYCREVKEHGLWVMKAFSVKDKLPGNLGDYVGVVDYFLFDTKGVNPGGNGVQFDWSILEDYDLKTPFLLSGGIGEEDAEQIKKIKNPRLYGVDINSRFEIEPGLKNEELLEGFIKEIKRDN